MLYSMTGFGKAETIYNEKKIHVEIKTLNSKNMDVNTHIAPLLLEKDMEIRSMVAEQLTRGKTDVNIWIEDLDLTQTSIINQTIVQQYVAQIRNISRDLSINEPADWWSTLTRLPNITQQTQEEELTDDCWEAVRTTVKSALAQVISFREQEGSAVRHKFEEKLHNIRTYLNEVAPFEEIRVKKIREQIMQGLKELRGVDYDKGRLEQEMIYYIEKLDINEEKQRLSNHLEYFATTMEAGGPVGKKLGFIAQEMGREINTMGSKSNQAELQKIVVHMKDELEQIKEQVLNVL